jgi:hypothetical protein
MKRWKKWQEDHCPRCGQTEDASHILICKGENSQQIWDTSLQLLSVWMASVQTDPDIIDTLIDHLLLWRQGKTTTPEGQESILHALDIQNDLGWHSILEGWLALEWDIVQQEYYTSIRSRRTGFRWLVLLIRKLWQIAWDLWTHRNTILHKTTNIHDTSTLAQTDMEIRRLFTRAGHILPIGKDRYLVRSNVHSLLWKPLIYKKAWLRATMIAIGDHSREKTRRGIRPSSLGRWLQQH